jgi:hypothetical protein
MSCVESYGFTQGENCYYIIKPNGKKVKWASPRKENQASLESSLRGLCVENMFIELDALICQHAERIKENQTVSRREYFIYENKNEYFTELKWIRPSSTLSTSPYTQVSNLL